MCITVPYIPKDLEDIGTEINKWIKGGENKGIDDWVESRGYKLEKDKNTSSDFKEDEKALNKKGNEIEFNLGNMSKEKQQRIIDTITELSSKYNTELNGVYINNHAREAGKVDIAYNMYLSSGRKTDVTHEFAHSLAMTHSDKLNLTNNKDFWKEIKKVRKEYQKAISKDFNKQITSYSLENVDEFFAEAFTVGYLKGTKDLIGQYSSISDFEFPLKVLEIADKYFKKRI